MRKRVNSDILLNEPVRKKSVTLAPTASEHLKQGEILTDLCGKEWKLGKAIGVGGFGEIYLASDNLNEEVKSNSQYVAKVEIHTSGPLFVEINCYLRIAKPEMITEWMDKNNLQHLGMPHYVASGSHTHKGLKYRFLILPRYERDLEVTLQSKLKFNLKTVLTVSTQILDVLQYIHDKGYIHCDIKASNILMGSSSPPAKIPVTQTRVVQTRQPYQYRACYPFRTLRIRKPQKSMRSLRPINKIFYLDDVPNFDEIVECVVGEKAKKEVDQVYLLDYGLATKYVTSQKQHKQFCNDERRAHAGTILFCSRDAHKGVQSRRSDLECLGFNMIYWLTGCLPWMDDADPEIVQKRKQRCIANIPEFLKMCFFDYPTFLHDYFKYLQKLQFEEKPNYGYCKKLFKTALEEYGYVDNNKLDFDNLEGWGRKQNKIKKVSENYKMKKLHLLEQMQRFPLHSNLPVKPKLRKKTKSKDVGSQMHWSKILIDPEFILKQKKVRDRKLTESSDSNPGNSISNMDIFELNPTYAMLEVFNKLQERLNGSLYNSPSHKNDDYVCDVDGYTPAMHAVYAQMKEREEMERDISLQHDKTDSRKRSVRSKAVKRPVRKKAVMVYSPPKLRTAKLISYVKKESASSSRKPKFGPLKRSYSLRG